MKICEVCYRRHWRAKINPNTGEQVKHRNGNKVFICIYCGNTQEEEQIYIQSKPKIKANQLYIDIEVSKSLFTNYGAKVPNKFLRPSNLIKERYIISWSASFIGSDKVFSDCVTPKEAMRFWDLKTNKTDCDERILPKLHKMMDSAEIIIGHNVKAFDIKHIFTRFEYYGLPPILDKKKIDTLTLARSLFAFEYNGLDYISQRLGLRPKDDITDEDWNNVLRGDKKTLEKVHAYNRGDVINGKGVYDKLVAWSGKSPDYGSIKSGAVGLSELLEELKELREQLESR